MLPLILLTQRFTSFITREAKIYLAVKNQLRGAGEIVQRVGHLHFM